MALAEFIALPYQSQERKSLLDRLVIELRSGQWNKFTAAIAFGDTSGNIPDLLDALRHFCDVGGEIRITFGADQFAPNNFGTDYDAIKGLLDKLTSCPNAKIFLYHELPPRRTFHPKVFLFSNATKHKALLIVGSSNWSLGGLVNNVEASLAVALDLNSSSDVKCFESTVSYFMEYWQHEPSGS